MVLMLDDYRLGEKMFSYVCNQEDFAECARLGLNVVYRNSRNTLKFWPEQTEFTVKEAFVPKLRECSSRDAFSISSRGRAFRTYSASSGDNLIFMTHKCNSNCVMCPESDAERKLEDTQTPEDILELIRYMPADTEHITISGGEPFLKGEVIFQVLQALKDNLPNTRYLLLTNGRALSYPPFLQKFIETCPPNMLVGIPLHGFNAGSHDSITRSPGGFHQTCRAIMGLIDAGIPVEIRIVVSRLNYSFMNEMADRIISDFPGASTVKIMGLEMLGNAAVNKESVWISYPYAFRASRAAIDKLIAAGIDTALYNFPLCAVDRGYHMICKKSISPYKVRFPEKCKECVAKEDCGGIFAGTIRLAEADCLPIKQYV